MQIIKMLKKWWNRKTIKNMDCHVNFNSYIGFGAKLLGVCSDIYYMNIYHIQFFIKVTNDMQRVVCGFLLLLLLLFFFLIKINRWVARK